ncbi:Nipped-B-like protein [Wickerhamomyces ciferrii]|uniref:Nipped-B-like protein n=1 Tax=Wickerhamomyces ciferrii (strain ATCC 14091 / BCRC 22168 / CBS 111 / JCM 3599 / NBRC 0793 / NRRL Y-1031 F-60-10) TaxID=1206466 RepID=K0KM61_WICCF|nr:Nipped-B-like protein [Wickerhamomyces ciferrii]CCH46335.1 Nipped-B-like protein [Wickerhamomyces ciferrii]
MLKLQVILVPPSAVRREQRLFQQAPSGHPNQSLNSSPNFLNRGIGTSTPNTNNNHNNSQIYQNSSFNSQVPIPFERPSLRKFLHITSRDKSLLEVAHEISIRFEKLYPDEPPLEILKLQDSQECDLDPDYVSGDVFDYDKAVRVLLNNELAPEFSPQNHIGDVSNITTVTQDGYRNKRSASPIFSSQLLPKKRRQDGRDSVWRGQGESNELRRRSTPLSNQIFPDHQQEQPENEQEQDEREENLSSRDVNNSIRNISINAEDSAETSLPPPEDDDTRYLDPKKSKAPVATSPLPPSSKRITSGMLVAPEPQLKDVEDEVLEEKQINDDITQRIIPVKKSLEDKTNENISAVQNGQNDEESDEESENENIANEDILPPPSQIKKHTQILEKPNVGNTSLSNTVTLEKPKEVLKPVPAPKKSDKSILNASPEKIDNVSPQPIDSSEPNTKEASPDIQLSQNTSASNILANISKRGDITNKDSFSDSDEDQIESIDEPEFTKDEIIKIFKSGRLPASVTKKFAKHNSQKPVPARQVRAAALKAAEKMSIPPKVGSKFTEKHVPAKDESEDEESTEESEEEEEDDDDNENSEEEGTEDEEESAKPSDSSDENVDYFEKKKQEAKAKAEKEATSTSATPANVSTTTKSADNTDSKIQPKPSQETKAKETSAPTKPVETKKSESVNGTKKEGSKPAEADKTKDDDDEDDDIEMVDASEVPLKDTPVKEAPVKPAPAKETPIEEGWVKTSPAKAAAIKETTADSDSKLGSLSQSLKEIDAQSTQLKDLPQLPAEVKVPESQLPARAHKQPAPPVTIYYARPGKPRVDIDTLPQEYPTEEVPGLDKIIDKLKDPRTPDNEFNECLKERRRLLYNARRRFLRKQKNEEAKGLTADTTANTSISSQPASSQIPPSSQTPPASQPKPSQPASKSKASSTSQVPTPSQSTKKPQAPAASQTPKSSQAPVSQTPKSSQAPASTPSKKQASKETPSDVSSNKRNANSNISLSQDSIDFDTSRFQDDEASERTRKEYEKAKEEIAQQRREAQENARKADQEARSKRAKYYSAKETPKSQEVINDSSDSGSDSGSGSDSDSDSGSDDDEDENDKTKKIPRIVNTPKGPIQSTNLRKSIAANKKLPDVQETASAPVTPISKKVEKTPSKQPQGNDADSKAKQPVKKPNSRYSLSSLSDLVSRGVPDVIDSLTPRSSRTKETPKSSQKKQEVSDSSESSDDDDDDDEDNSDTDDSSDSDESSSDEELKGSQKYLNKKAAKNLINQNKRKTKTNKAFRGLMKDAKKK